MAAPLLQAGKRETSELRRALQCDRQEDLFKKLDERTPVEPRLLPEHGQGLLTVLTASPGYETTAFSIGSETDGLPAIVRKAESSPRRWYEIERFAA